MPSVSLSPSQRLNCALTLKEWIKLGNLEDREVVTKVMFEVSLSIIPRYFNDAEVPVKVEGMKIGYLDLLIVEIKPASAGAKTKHFVFECSFLLGGDRGKVEAMSIDEVLKLKCSNYEQYDQGRIMQAILNAGDRQLKEYVQGLGSGKLLWRSLKKEW
ncbi:hypothetical protein BC937DRAFT_94202 [Endogone sp. FLAS-F59071]|nr:hypothetical protein BC937DRAFT_94202 [Endogone sp. FLAS-F59071]|eukprot:RUS20855.1 hypothetical protein BC937DRAFT_94202 [Endogone sp. FLAS-F59071]